MEDAYLRDRQVELADGRVEVTPARVQDELREAAEITHQLALRSCLHACNRCTECQDLVCSCSRSVHAQAYARQSSGKPPRHSASRTSVRSATAWSSTAS